MNVAGRMAALAIAATCLWAPTARAQEYQSRAAGGPGGAPFTLRCGSGDYLVGLRARAGTWIDAIAPMCANWDAGRRAFLEPGIGPMQGGTGGQVMDFRCDSASVIVGLTTEGAGNRENTVGLIIPRCATALDPNRRTRGGGADQFGTSISDRASASDDPNLGTSAVPYYNESGMPKCGNGAVAVGIFGGAGRFVDRIGLICAPAPAPLAAPRPVSRVPGAVATAPIATPRPITRVPGAVATAPIAPPRAVTQMPDVVIAPPVAASVPPGTCRSGFVWREASPADLTCVPPEARTRTRQENVTASTRVNPYGAYGPNTCVSGFVWREAFDGDVVCVTPEARIVVQAENVLAPERTLRPR